MCCQYHQTAAQSPKLESSSAEPLPSGIGSDTLDQAHLTVTHSTVIGVSPQSGMRAAKSDSTHTWSDLPIETSLDAEQPVSSLETEINPASAPDAENITMSSPSSSSTNMSQTLVSDPTTQPLGVLANTEHELQQEQAQETYVHSKTSNPDQALKVVTLPTRIKGVTKMQHQPQHRAQNSKSSSSLTDYTMQLMYLEALNSKHLQP